MTPLKVFYASVQLDRAKKSRQGLDPITLRSVEKLRYTLASYREGPYVSEAEKATAKCICRREGIE